MAYTLIYSAMSMASMILKFGTTWSCDIGTGFATASCSYLFDVLLDTLPGSANAVAVTAVHSFPNCVFVAYLTFPVIDTLSFLKWPVVSVWVSLDFFST